VLCLSFLPLFPLLWCFLPFCSQQVFFTLPRTVAASCLEHHNLSFAAACFHHRDHPRPVFAAASYWVDPVCLQPSLPHPSFNFCTSSCWRFV
jgi:hypothetical protein